MYIGVNAMQVRAAKSGVGQYIHALTEAASGLFETDRFLVYCNKANEINYKYDLPNTETKVWGMSGAPRPVRLSYEALTLPSELKQNGIQVFHGASNFLPARRACPYVVTIHDLSYHVHPERCPPVRRYYWYAMTKRTVAVADRIITISENSWKDIVHYFPQSKSRIRVIGNAAHRRFQKLPMSRNESMLIRFEPRFNGRPYLLYLGTLEPGKNVTRVIQAFDSIAAMFPDHLLVMAGDKGWLYESVFETIETSAHNDRIIYVGHVSDTEAVHLFNFADVFVFPSMYEGFGLPPLEAMQCGCPVITSDRSSIPEVVGDAAVMVNPESVSELAKGMKQVLANPRLRQELSLAGLERARLFSWEKSARQTMEVYRDAAADR